MLNSDSKRKKFGSSEIYDGALIPSTRSYNRIPGSRGSSQRPHSEKGKGRAKGTSGSRYTRVCVLTGQKLQKPPWRRELPITRTRRNRGIFTKRRKLKSGGKTSKGSSESESDIGWDEIGNMELKAKWGLCFKSRQYLWLWGFGKCDCRRSV